MKEWQKGERQRYLLRLIVQHSGNADKKRVFAIEEIARITSGSRGRRTVYTLRDHADNL